MTTTLDEVRSFMSYLGWSDGGNPGSVKRDAGGNLIAHYHDDAWIELFTEAGTGPHSADRGAHIDPISVPDSAR